MNSSEVLEALGRLRVVPVVRLSNARLAMRCAEWLIEAGFRALEITMTIPDAVSVIAAFTGRPGIIVGGGTVLTAGQAEACIAAGAQFVVAPSVEPAVGEACGRRGIACVLGAMSPTEVRSALAAGAGAVKIFPAGALGGASYVGALRQIFPDVRMVPTGGVTADTAADFLAAGAFFVGIGGNLMDEAAVARGDRAAVIAAARAVLAALHPTEGANNEQPVA